MKHRLNTGAGLVLVLLVQLACNMGNLPAQYQCEMEGGVWHPPLLEEQGWCEEKSGSKNENPAEAVPTEPQINPSIGETEVYSSPTPASAQECNATLYIQTQVEVIKNTQELYYRECDHKVTATNIHPSEGIWIVRRINTGTHSPSKDCDICNWYSDLTFPTQGWEKTFRATFFSDGQASFEYVDKVAGVFNRPECLYLLNSPEVEAISQAVEWACSP